MGKNTGTNDKYTRTSIKDIAKHTGFSTTTISLVLNGKGKKISKKTKDIIFEAAEKLNYRPNQLAISLVKKRTKTIGLIISDIRNLFFSNLAKGVEDECRENGWNLILCNSSDIHQRDLDNIQMLADKGVDGIIYGMSADSDAKKAKKCLDLMNKLKMPFILIDRFIVNVDCCSVVVDHKCGGYLATKHLIELGHRRIACVTGPMTLSDSIYRLEGYKKALEEDNIEYDPSILFEGKYTWESGIAAVDYLMGKDFTAIFAFNDMSAYGVYSRLKEYNLSVPDDISVVGYDNILFSEIIDPPLTTINQPIVEMGEEAARQLMNMIDNETFISKNITFQPTLIIRKSTKAKA